MCDTENGNVTTEPQEMAKILQKHWGQVFSHREVNTALLQQWLEEVFPDGGAGRSTAGLPEQSSHLWRVRREDVAEAIANTKNTMPGPDRIPYMAWKALGDLGIDVLFEAPSALQEPGATGFLCGCSGEVETDGQSLTSQSYAASPRSQRALTQRLGNILPPRPRGHWRLLIRTTALLRAPSGFDGSLRWSPGCRTCRGVS